MSKFFQGLKMLADEDNRHAMEVLESRGFMFGTHYGTTNAARTLEEMDVRFEYGELYEWLSKTYGMDVI